MICVRPPGHRVGDVNEGMQGQEQRTCERRRPRALVESEARQGKTGHQIGTAEQLRRELRPQCRVGVQARHQPRPQPAVDQGRYSVRAADPLNSTDAATRSDRGAGPGRGHSTGRDWTRQRKLLSKTRLLALLRYEPVSSLQFLEMQGDFDEMQGGHQAFPAKSDWISIIWTGPSLLPEQGGYDFLAGRPA
jgi:hypothetical protein